eukprot:358210-Chlamydomonas_euryale.AAC.7
MQGWARAGSSTFSPLCLAPTNTCMPPPAHISLGPSAAPQPPSCTSPCKSRCGWMSPTKSHQPMQIPVWMDVSYQVAPALANPGVDGCLLPSRTSPCICCGLVLTSPTKAHQPVETQQLGVNITHLAVQMDQAARHCAGV